LNTAVRVMLKDLRRRARAPLAPLMMLAFPFLFAGLIALAFGGGGATRAPRFQVALVDQDGGLVARFVRGAFGQEQVSRILEVTETDLPHALRLIERNRVGGAIVIPSGFSQAVLDRQPAQLRVLRNPASAIGAAAVEETAEFLALLLEGATNVLARPLERLRSMMAAGAAAPGAAGGTGVGPGWAPDASVSEIAVLVNQSLRGVSRFATPPAIYLKEPAATDSTGTTSKENGFSQIFGYVLPGMAAFALFFLAVGLMGDIFRERSLGTLNRQLTAPVRAVEIVLGKILATVAVGVIVAAGMALIGGVLLQVRADLGAFALLCLAFLLAVTGFVTLLYSFARNEQQGGTLTAIVMMVMAFLGGSFIPLESMPRFVAGIAPLTLNYWAIRGFQTLLVSHGGLADVAVPLAVLLAVGIVSVLAGGSWLQRRMMRGA
jgi:ABC-2 type transport system permease protein